MKSTSQKLQPNDGVGATVDAVVGVVGGTGVVVGVVDGTKLVMPNMESHMLWSIDINDYGQLEIVLGAFETGERKKV
jgi:hypothetical protein